MKIMTTWNLRPQHEHVSVSLIRREIPSLDFLSDLRIADLWRMFSQDMKHADWVVVSPIHLHIVTEFCAWLKSNDDISVLTEAERM